MIWTEDSASNPHGRRSADHIARLLLFRSTFKHSFFAFIWFGTHRPVMYEASPSNAFGCRQMHQIDALRRWSASLMVSEWCACIRTWALCKAWTHQNMHIIALLKMIKMSCHSNAALQLSSTLGNVPNAVCRLSVPDFVLNLSHDTRRMMPCVQANAAHTQRIVIKVRFQCEFRHAISAFILEHSAVECSGGGLIISLSLPDCQTLNTLARCSTLNPHCAFAKHQKSKTNG